MENAGRFEAVRGLRTAEQHSHRGAVLEASVDFALPGAAFHRRDVAEGEEAPVVAGSQRETLEARLVASLIEHAELLRGLVPAHAAGREVHAGGRDSDFNRFF